MKTIAYADPPYIGCANYYEEKTEVDHVELIDALENQFDGWILHTHSPGLRLIAPLLPEKARVMAWTKPFAAFKRNVPVAYAWEPVIVKPARKQVVDKRIVMRDWVSESITLKKGLTGAKPPKVVEWTFHMVGAKPGDTLFDLYPGTGIVDKTWKQWIEQYPTTKNDRFFRR